MRDAIYSQSTEVVPVTLIELTHPDPSPLQVVRLSSDATTNFLLSDDPLTDDITELCYGTIHKGNLYYYVLMSRVWPDDKEGENPSGQLQFENVVSDYTTILRSFLAPARCDIKLVVSSHPEYVQAEFKAMATVSSRGDQNKIVIDISREDYTMWPWPMHRMTKDRFPGLF